MKPLDMADKYEPASYQDDEPTVKIDMRAILPKLYLSEEEDCEPTLPSQRNPLHQEKRYPGIGLLICLGTGLLFWGTVAYFLFR